ncbi:MAG: InlB B-repeat-containing protein [Acidimicrobiia bacterium]
MKRILGARARMAVSVLVTLVVIGALGAAGSAVMTGTSGGGAVGAAATRTALINSDSVFGSPSQEEAIATSLGLTVTLVDDATWASMTQAQFASYDVLIVGDPSCGFVPSGVATSAPTWGPVVMGHAGGRTVAGNRVEVGTDPVFHDGGDYTSPDARGTIIRDGIAYAANNVGTTGMYFDSTCGDTNGGADTTAILQAMSEGSGTWTIDTTPPCGGNVSLIAAHPSFTDLTTTSLQGWSCSVHESFPTFPTDWSALAVATDTTTQPTCGVDPGTGLNACGEAYILVAGSRIVVHSEVISVSPLDSTNPVDTDHTVTANVHQVGGSPPVAGQHVDFTVTGQNPGATGTCVPADCKSDASGNVSFTYHDTNGAGDDTIKASFTDSAGSLQTATAQKHWVTGTGTHSVTVNIVGPGSVASTPGGISCPSTCSASFPDPTTVDLAATPASGATFVGWTGDYTGSTACSVTTDADRVVTATFEGTTPPPPSEQEIDGDGKVCSPKTYFDFDDVEGHRDGSLTGSVKFSAHDKYFKSTKITALVFDDNVGLVTGVGKFNDHRGYDFVAVVVDHGRHGADPDIFALNVEDATTHASVLTSVTFQGVCDGDIRIHTDSDY